MSLSPIKVEIYYQDINNKNSAYTFDLEGVYLAASELKYLVAKVKSAYADIEFRRR